MAERGTGRIAEIVSTCERYWLQAGVAAGDVAEMRAELEAHLHDAAAEGKAPEAVVGSDVAEFAAAWAEAQRGPDAAPVRPEIGAQPAPRVRARDLALFGGLVAIAVLLAILAPKEESMDDVELFRWIWVIAAVFLGVAEMLTAGFFMLPFAVGAGAAAVLAWFNVAVWAQFIVFILVSIGALIGLQRFVRREDEYQPSVGANRFIDRRATVLEQVDRVSGTGRVRMDTEEWRATTDGGPIPAGAEVRIVEVRGTRLVVEVDQG